MYGVRCGACVAGVFEAVLGYGFSFAAGLNFYVFSWIWTHEEKNADNADAAFGCATRRCRLRRPAVAAALALLLVIITFSKKDIGYFRITLLLASCEEVC